MLHAYIYCHTTLERAHIFVLRRTYASISQIEKLSRCAFVLFDIIIACVCVMPAAGCCNNFFSCVSFEKWGRRFSVLPPKNRFAWKLCDFLCTPFFNCCTTMVMYILLANRCKKGDKFRLTHWYTQTLNANQNKRIYVEERAKKTESNTNDGLFNLSMDNEELSWALILHAYRCEG